jgi:hypothetical protein
MTDNNFMNGVQTGIRSVKYVGVDLSFNVGITHKYKKVTLLKITIVNVQLDVINSSVPNK